MEEPQMDKILWLDKGPALVDAVVVVHALWEAADQRQESDEHGGDSDLYSKINR
jgi:hypothetical protein